ncbi:MAG TPA: hypothetical protein VGG44_03460 [Tepidisphaeraceae bacterium]
MHQHPRADQIQTGHTLTEGPEALGKPAHPCTVSRTLARLNPPRKKSTHAAEQTPEQAPEQHRPDVNEARNRWFEKFAEERVDQLVYRLRRRRIPKGISNAAPKIVSVAGSGTAVVASTHALLAPIRPAPAGVLVVCHTLPDASSLPLKSPVCWYSIPHTPTDGTL